MIVPSEPIEVRSGLERSGLVDGEIMGDDAGGGVAARSVDGRGGSKTGENGTVRSLGRRGDRGTFHRLASSGKSSSMSSYSASSSLTGFLLGCHDPLLTGTCCVGGG